MDKKKKVTNKNAVRIVITWDGKEGEGSQFKLKFTPDPLDKDTDIRKHLVVLANAFAAGTEQLMSVVKPLPQPTEEELKLGTYNFEDHGMEFGEGLFGLYNYKKALMEEFVSVVGRVLPDVFHDVLFVKGAQEKIFETLRKQNAEKRAMEEEEALLSEEEKNKGVVN